MIFSFTQVIADIKAEKTRILLTIFAVAIGTAAIMVMLAVGAGLRQTLGIAMSSAGSNIITIKPGRAELPYQGNPGARKLVFTSKDLNLLQQELSDLATITGEYSNSVELVPVNQDFHAMKVQEGRGRNSSTTQQISGVDVAFGELRNLTAAPEGRFINSLDIELRRRVIFIGDRLAERLFPGHSNPVKQIILVNGTPFTVIGMLPERMRIGGGSSRSDNHGAWIPITTFRAIYGTDKLVNIVLRPYTTGEADVIKKRTQNLLARLHGANPQDNNIMQMFDAQVIQQQTDLFLFGMMLFLGLIGGLTLAVAGVGIANVMYLTVKNATREIGLRMALGARRIHIMLHYLTEALLATLSGGILGILLGLGLVWCAKVALQHYTSTLQFMGEITPQISLPIMLIVVTVLVIVGLCAGIFPARQAANVMPAEALRDE